MMEEKNDRFLIQKMKEGLDGIDKNLNIKTPDMGRFRNMVAAVEAKKRKKRRKETLVFALSALAILTLETYSFNQSIAFFITIQAVALVSFPAMLLIKFKRKKGQEGVQ